MKRLERRTALYRQAANNVGGVKMGDPTPHTVTELQAMDVYMYITETDEADALYKRISVLVKGHDRAVLDSYEYFATLAASELDINVEKVYEPPKKIERLTVLKSVHIFKKHRVQYEMRTYYRCIELKHLTGSTAQVYLEYIQRNLPEGVAMEVTKTAVEKLPEHIKRPVWNSLPPISTLHGRLLIGYAANRFTASTCGFPKPSGFARALKMGKRREKKQLFNSLTKKQKKHLKEFGEQHPFHDKVDVTAGPSRVTELPGSPEHSSEGSDEDSEPEGASAYQTLLSSLTAAPDEDTEEDDDDDDDSDDEEGEDEGAELEEDEQPDDDDVHTAELGGDGDPDDTAEDFTDKEHESKFSLESNCLESDATPEGPRTPSASCQESKTPCGRVNVNDPQLVFVTILGRVAVRPRFETLVMGHIQQASLESAEEDEGGSAPTYLSLGVKKDPFMQHLYTELDEEDIRKASSGSRSTAQLKWQRLGNLLLSNSLETCSSLTPGHAPCEGLLHKPLSTTWPKVNRPFVHAEEQRTFTPLQQELFSLMAAYKDVYFPESSVLGDGPPVRALYCLHVLNHVLKANSLVLANNAHLRDRKANLKEEEEDERRDQGLTRPKVLILVPFRDAALRVVQTFISLLEATDKKLDVSNKKRFKDEFGSGPEDRPPSRSRPDDYHATFSGNVDDHFRIGVAILQKSMRLYAPFYSSDIIIASPLGLRTLLGVEGDVKRDFDFLSSIEVLILDQADIFLMQNWEHVLHIMRHLNLQPLDPHGVDFSRVRMWNLSNAAQCYRQTLIFSSIQEPQINAILTKSCHNYRGQVAVKNLPKVGSICQVVVPLPHVFQRFKTDSFADQDARFQFFVDKVLPQYRDAVMSHTLIYVPSYFDYVRLRNFLRKEEIGFAPVCEYSKKSDVSRARHFFQNGVKPFLLLTERFHFFRRHSIKGVRNLIFYALPSYPHFYSEVCNMLSAPSSGEEATWTCTTLYSRYDVHRLASVTGAERAAQMLQSQKSVHLFVTGGEEAAL
ncbi:DIEXF factor, partial [Polypterus senegalus]